MKKDSPFPLNEKMTQLEDIERYFQQPDINLEEALEKHTVALALAKEIQDYLAAAETTIQQLQ